MRHDQAMLGREFDIVDVAAIWPQAGAVAQAPIGAVDELASGNENRPAFAVPDVPAAVGWMMVSIYCGIVAIFFLTMAKGPQAMFMIAISGLYVAIFLTVPRIFLAVEDDQSPRPRLDAFLDGGMDTFTGHLSGRAALAQMLVVPIMLSVALLIIGTAALWILP